MFFPKSLGASDGIDSLGRKIFKCSKRQLGKVAKNDVLAINFLK